MVGFAVERARHRHLSPTPLISVIAHPEEKAQLGNVFGPGQGSLRQLFKRVKTCRTALWWQKVVAAASLADIERWNPDVIHTV